MGGSVSSGQNNDELIDNLVEGGLIRTNQIERVFRCIDRGVFFLPEAKDRAYRDLAWREGHIHVSAPCVYTKVLENLELTEGLSFLNVGSGTGYFSSMVGLILGPTGINHNIEIHKELITHAKQRVKEVVNNATLFDEFDFCVPQFVHGNCMHLITDNNDTLLYDRIYVGACVNQEQEQFFTGLLKIGGVLIMPLNDSLVKIRKIDDNCTSKHSIMNVSFASLITSQIEKSDANESFVMPKLNPFSLQELCRFKIRRTIRSTIQSEFPDFYNVKRQKSTFNPKKKLKEVYADSESHQEHSQTDEHTNIDQDFPLTRFERIFSPNYSVNAENENSFEHQIRIMIYGHLLGAANNSLQIAVNNAENNEDRDSDAEEFAENDRFSRVSSSSGDSFRSFLNDFNLSRSTDDENSDENDDNSSEADLFDLFAENVRKASSSNMIDLEQTSLNSNVDTEPEETSIPTTSKSLDSASISSDSDTDEHDDGIGPDYDYSMPRSSTKRLPIIKRKRNASSGYSTSSNDFSSSLTEIAENSEAHDREECRVLTEYKKIEQTVIQEKDNPVKLNLLRMRVLTLNIPTSMKHFLLYNRKI